MVDRLSPLDASMLRLEGASQPMHTGGLSLFEPGLTFGQVRERLETRLHLVPRARQRVRRPGPAAGNRAIWVDDERFDLSYHLRHAAVPPPGDIPQLWEEAARVAERPLDRSRPLWEVYFIEGLRGGRTCLLRKVHLAMAGGGGDPFGVLLQPHSDEDAAGSMRAPRWEPRVAPTTAALALDEARDRLRRARDMATGVRRVAGTPERLARAGGQVAGGLLALAGRVVRPAPASPLNRPLTQQRRFATAACGLDDLRRIRAAFGGSINDVVVAAVGDAVGRLLRWRGHDTKNLDLRIMVPVRVHGGDDAARDGLAHARTIGEGVVAVIVPLPVMEMDPVARLYRIMGEMADLKESRQAVAAGNLVRLAGYAPPSLHAMAARVASAEQRYSLALSNAPGPQTPRYLGGVRMEQTYPFIPLAGDAALSVAVTSYAGQVAFGLLGDRAALPDVDTLGVFVEDALADLVTAADKA